MNEFNKKIYKNNYILVADIVGLTDILKEKSKESETIIDCLFEKNLGNFTDKENIYNCEDVITLNDTIVFIFKDNSKLDDAILVARDLFKVPNFLFQGAISKGEIIVYSLNNCKIVLGDAFLDAHKYTSKYPIAIYIDEKVKNEANDNIFLLNNMIDNEKVTFVSPFDINFNPIGDNILYLNNFVESMNYLYKRAKPEQKYKFLLCIQILENSNKFDFVYTSSTLKITLH